MTHNPLKYAKDLKAEQMNRLFVDLDGTLAESIFPKKGIGKKFKFNCTNIINYAKKHKLKIWIYTSRPDTDVINIRNWCRDNKIKIHGILTGKPNGHGYIDDKNIQGIDLVNYHVE